MSGTQPEPGRSIVWLASYPKSGNTWLRALLTAWFSDAHEVNINALVGAPIQLDRQLLDDSAGISSVEMNPAELIPYRAQLHRELAAGTEYPLLLKTHCAFAHSASGAALFPREASAGAIVVVRDPRDIVPSLADQFGIDFDRAIDLMADPKAALDLWPDRASSNLPQLMGSWSANVSGWLDQRAIPVLLLRYEEMLADPSGSLHRVLDFLGFAGDSPAIGRAVDAAGFERLRCAEKQSGFVEARKRSQGFFRSGTVGAGRRQLSKAQIGALESAHRAAMERLGYATDTANSN